VKWRPLITTFLDQPCVYHSKLSISTFHPHKMIPMFFMLGSICLDLSDMAAANVATVAASITSWKKRTIIFNKQHIQGGNINYTPSSSKTNYQRVMPLTIYRGRRDRDRMVVEFTTTVIISAYHHYCCECESRL
jgi:hypothetical protein